MRILRVNEFYGINEGILSSIGYGLSKLLGGKKGEIESLLKKVRQAKMDEVKETVEIEREISKYSKSDSMESRFNVQNLNKQLRTISSLKEREAQSYIKELNKISKNNPKLEAMVASELSKIQVEATRELIKRISPYKEETDLQRLNREFDSLVKSATAKEKEYQRSELSDEPRFVPDETSANVISFVDLDSQKASEFLKNLPDTELEQIHRSLTDWRFKLEVELGNQVTELRKEIKKTEKEGSTWIIPQLEAELLRITYHNKKPIDKIKSRIQLVEKEIKTRRYGNQ
jgi:hypothetical protein